MMGLKEMNQQSLKAYLDLIQGLLSCPRGEEWILLRQHGELVNGELVKVIEQVANHLAREGNVKAAKYLHNWAGKLHHMMTENIAPPANNKDKTQDYLKLIQALIDCPEGEEKAILEAHQELINPELTIF
jgi:maltose-binding protein MalE